MDLKSGYPYWAIKNGLMHAFAPLKSDLRCEVAVIGGGISGALIADELVARGHAVALFEERGFAWGSTAASTALLQYEIDTHMVDLARCYGEANAALAYQQCAHALTLLRNKAREIGDVDFRWNDSLYFASKRRHAEILRREFSMRARHGLSVELLETAELADRYAIQAPVAILSHQAAAVDPYAMAYRLLMRLQKQGVPIHDRIRIEALTASQRSVTLRTEKGQVVRADYLVMATGYAAQKWLKHKVAKNHSSYAFITDPFAQGDLGPLKDTLLWESARPYLYMRSTADNRLLVGGEDDDIDIPARRDRRVGKKARTLQKKVARMFPELPLQPAFAWGGTFAETADGLPFFGPHPQYGKRVLFAMAYGGNGITYSMLGAGLLAALIARQKHPLEHPVLSAITVSDRLVAIGDFAEPLQHHRVIAASTRRSSTILRPVRRSSGVEIGDGNIRLSRIQLQAINPLEVDI